MKWVELIIGNFYYRNAALLCIVLSPIFIQPVIYGNADTSDLTYRTTAVTLLYLVILLHNMFFVEKILMKKKYLVYLIATLLSVYIMHKLLIALGAYVYRSIPRFSTEKWLSVFWVDLVYIYAGFAVYIGHRYFRRQEKENKLKLLHKEVELKRLQEQLHPHFLFNALNNIYSYSLQDNEKTNELILMLSEQMRYILTMSDSGNVSVLEESGFIKNYIGFEKERLGNRCTVVFNEDIQNDTVNIRPLLFFPFVENAFKHGTNSIGKCEIHIELKTSRDKIYFSITNSIFNNDKVVSTNTGLKNAEKRLRLLYPNKHKLNINAEKGQYHVQLTIDV